MATSPNQALFLDIELKKDSAAKLVAVVGKPHNEFYFAKECNATTSAVNMLRSLLALNESQVYAIMGAAKVDLGVILTNPVDHINALVIPIELGISKKYITFTFEDVLYVYAFVGTPAANYGFGVNNEKVVTEDFLFIWKSGVNEIGSGASADVSAVVKLSGSAPEVGGAYVFTMHNALTAYGLIYSFSRQAAGIYKLEVDVNGSTDPAILDNVIFSCIPEANTDGSTILITPNHNRYAEKPTLMLYVRNPTSNVLQDGAMINYVVEIKCFVNPQGI